MVQDQYRSVMQYSVSREPLGKEKVATDWYCAKVNDSTHVVSAVYEIDLENFSFSSLVWSVQF